MVRACIHQGRQIGRHGSIGNHPNTPNLTSRFRMTSQGRATLKNDILDTDIGNDRHRLKRVPGSPGRCWFKSTKSESVKVFLEAPALKTVSPPQIASMETTRIYTHSWDVQEPQGRPSQIHSSFIRDAYSQTVENGGAEFLPPCLSAVLGPNRSVGNWLRLRPAVHMRVYDADADSAAVCFGLVRTG